MDAIGSLISLFRHRKKQENFAISLKIQYLTLSDSAICYCFLTSKWRNFWLLDFCFMYAINAFLFRAMKEKWRNQGLCTYLRCRLAASLGKASWISGGISWCLASVVWSNIITSLTFSKSVVVVTLLQINESMIF